MTDITDDRPEPFDRWDSTVNVRYVDLHHFCHTFYQLPDWVQERTKSAWTRLIDALDAVGQTYDDKDQEND